MLLEQIKKKKSGSVSKEKPFEMTPEKRAQLIALEKNYEASLVDFNYERVTPDADAGKYFFDESTGYIQYKVVPGQGFYRIYLNNYLDVDQLIQSNPTWEGVVQHQNQSLIKTTEGTKHLMANEVINLGRVEDFKVFPVWALHHMATPEDGIKIGEAFVLSRSQKLQIPKARTLQKENEVTLFSPQNYFLLGLTTHDIIEAEGAGFPLTQNLLQVLFCQNEDPFNLNQLIHLLNEDEQYSFLYHTTVSKNPKYQSHFNYLLQHIDVSILNSWSSTARKIFINILSLKGIDKKKGKVAFVQQEIDLFNETDPFEKMEEVIRQVMVGFPKITDNKKENEVVSEVEAKLTFMYGHIKFDLYFEVGVGFALSAEIGDDRSFDVSFMYTLMVEGGVDVALWNGGSFNTSVGYMLSNSNKNSFDSIQHFTVYLLHCFAQHPELDDIESLHNYLSEPQHQDELRKKHIKYDILTHNFNFKIGGKTPNDKSIEFILAFKKGHKTNRVQEYRNGKLYDKSQDFINKEESNFELSTSFKIDNLVVTFSYIKIVNSDNKDDNGKYLQLRVDLNSNEIALTRLTLLQLGTAMNYLERNNISKDNNYSDPIEWMKKDGIKLLIHLSTFFKSSKATPSMMGSQKVLMDNYNKLNALNKVKGKLLLTFGAEAKFHIGDHGTYLENLSILGTYKDSLSLALDRDTALLRQGHYGKTEFSVSRTTKTDIYIGKKNLLYLSKIYNGLTYENDPVEERELRFMKMKEAQDAFNANRVDDSIAIKKDYWEGYDKRRTQAPKEELERFYAKYSSDLKELGISFIEMLIDTYHQGEELKDSGKIPHDQEVTWGMVNINFMNGIDLSFLMRYVDGTGPMFLNGNSVGKHTNMGSFIINNFTDKTIGAKKFRSPTELIVNFLFPIFYKLREQYNFNIFHYEKNIF